MNELLRGKEGCTLQFGEFSKGKGAKKDKQFRKLAGNLYYGRKEKKQLQKLQRRSWGITWITQWGRETSLEDGHFDFMKSFTARLLGG